MKTVVMGLNALIFVQHTFFFILEAVLWKRPLGQKIFRTTKDQAEQTSVLAMNQGFYNLFFAFGFLLCFVFGMDTHLAMDSHSLLVFNLYLAISIVIAALVGGITVSHRILFIQGIPSVALALILSSLLIT